MKLTNTENGEACLFVEQFYVVRNTDRDVLDIHKQLLTPWEESCSGCCAHLPRSPEAIYEVVDSTQNAAMAITKAKANA